MVGCLWAQRGQLGSIFFCFQRVRCGVGRVSVPALMKNDNCPVGGPAGFSSTPGWNIPVLQLPGSCLGQLVSSVSCHFFLSFFL